TVRYNPVAGFTHLLLILILSFILITGIGYWMYKNGQIKVAPSQNQEQDTLTTTPTPQIPSDWKTYRNEEYGFEFKYPSKLTPSEYNGIVTLNHSIPYKNGGDCDLSGGTQVYDTLNDFNVTFELKQSIITPDYIDGNYSSGILEGPWQYYGIEGCGSNNYYFQIAGGKTLIVKKDLVQAFSGISTVWDMDKILSTPGVINKKESDYLFDQILSTFEFLPDVLSCTNYTSEELGFEIQCPPNYFLRTLESGKVQISNNSLFDENEFALVITFEPLNTSTFKPSDNPDILNILDNIGYKSFSQKFSYHTSSNFSGDPPWGYYQIVIASQDINTDSILITTRIHRIDELTELEHGTNGQLAKQAKQILSTFKLLK
ncbi:MAG TPA: hypothetical protein VF985_03835, partial [Mariniflexile sp.]